MNNPLKHIALLTLLLFFSTCSSPDKQNLLSEKVNTGKVLFEASNCTQCHSLSGKDMYGPALNNILQTQIKVLRDGKEDTVLIDRDYLYRSIEKPDFEKHIDFRTRKMPQPTLTFKEIDAITEYLIFINEKD